VIINLFATLVETHLIALEASGVIALRMLVISQGGAAAEAEAKLMVTEKMDLFKRAASGIATGSTDAHVYRMICTSIRSNYDRLRISIPPLAPCKR
jgi:hypothetical protein